MHLIDIGAIHAGPGLVFDGCDIAGLQGRYDPLQELAVLDVGLIGGAHVVQADGQHVSQSGGHSAVGIVLDHYGVVDQSGIGSVDLGHLV